MLIEKLTQYIAYITAFLLVVLVLLVVYDASMRYMFSAGSTAMQELEWHLFDGVVLLSIAYALKEKAHVRVDIFYNNFSTKTKIVVDTLSLLLFILPFSLLIAYIGIEFTELSFIQMEASSDPGGLSYRWIVKSLIPLAFFLLTLQAGVELMKNIKQWKSL